MLKSYLTLSCSFSVGRLENNYLGKGECTKRWQGGHRGEKRNGGEGEEAGRRERELFYSCIIISNLEPTTLLSTYTSRYFKQI